ncbi:MAG: DUF167 domain-containing protein [Desulfuromonadia bacterium]
MTLPEWIRETPEGVIITLHVQPRARRTELCGAQGNALKVRLTSPPVDDAANTQCRELFASIGNIPKSMVEIIRGGASRSKTILLRGATIDCVLPRIHDLTGGNES